MPWTNPVDPVTNTVITVAYAQSNLTGPLRWLRLLTGNADPPASNYVVTSDSVGATSWKTGLAAIQNVLGFRPVSANGDTMGDLVLQRAAAPTTGALFFGNSGGVLIFDTGTEIQLVGLPVHVVSQPLTVDGAVSGGTQAAGVLSLLGLNVGNNGIFTAGAVNPANYTGGSTTVGQPSVLGLVVGNNGVSSSGPYGGGSTTVGPTQTLFRGLSVGASGIASSGQIAANGSLVASSITSNGQIAATVAGGGAALITVQSTTVCPNLAANLLADQAGTGRYATITPTGNAIPVADATGKLASGWLPAAAQAFTQNMVVGFNDIAANIPSGWARLTAANGRILVGDSNGPLNGQTFAAGGSYGSAWSHAHGTGWSSHTHPASGSGQALVFTATTGGPSATRSDMNTITPGASVANDAHTHSFTNAAVTGNTAPAGPGGTSTDTWLPMMYGVFWIEK